MNSTNQIFLTFIDRIPIMLHHKSRRFNIHTVLQRGVHTLRLLLILSNCPAVFSPILCEPHSSKPILAYVNVIDPMGKKYVSTVKITLYL